MNSKILLRTGKFAVIAAAPFLRDAALGAVESWVRRLRERTTGCEPGYADLIGPDGYMVSQAAEDCSSSTPIAAPPLASDAGIRLRVVHTDNLQRAWRRVARNPGTSPGVDNQTVNKFALTVPAELAWLATELSSASYRPLPLLCFGKRKNSGRRREIGIPAIRDRVAQTAIAQILENTLDPGVSEWCFSYRLGTGCHPALETVDRLVKAGNPWVVRADIMDCFDSISHQRLLDLVGERTGDPDAADLVRAVIAGPRLRQRKLHYPPCGIPQGSPLSPILANLYLDPVDRLIRDASYNYLRYADDIFLACSSKRVARKALALIARSLRKIDLRLNEEKTAILHAQESGFEFLGHLYQSGKWEPIPSRIEELKGAIGRRLGEGKKSGAEKIADAAVLWRGWRNYYHPRCPAAISSLQRWFDAKTASVGDIAPSESEHDTEEPVDKRD